MKTNLFKFEFLGKVAILFLMITLSTSQINAQACGCKQSVNVSLDASGNAVITAAMMLTNAETCALPPGVLNHTVTVMFTPAGLPIAGSPNVKCEHIGKRLYAKVSNGINSCWGEVVVMDELAPRITPPSGPTVLTCLEYANFEPFVTENCNTYTLTQIEGTTTKNNCNSSQPSNVLKTVSKTYTATDASGNVSAPVTFDFVITIINSLNDIVMPLPVQLQCDANFAVIPAGNPHAGNPSPVAIGARPGTGVPRLNGVGLYPDPVEACNLYVGFSDVRLPAIGCVTKIMRSWEIIEWSCANRTRAPFVQIIEIVDTQAPSITKPNDMTASTSNHACEANIILPAATILDNCSPNSALTVDVTYPGGFNKGVNGGQAKLPVGVHEVQYTVYDACYNSNTATITVTVEDNTPPVTICDEFTTVAVSNDGKAWVPATVFDDGSYDECALAKMVVKRMNNAACGTCETPELPGFKLLGEFGTGAGKSYYYISNHAATPKIALKTAKALEGYGVSYETTNERTFVYDKVKDLNLGLNFLIGLTDVAKEGAFVWESGASSSYNPAPAPSLDYVVVSDVDGSFINVGSDVAYRYVVEIKNPCGFSSHALFCCSDIGTAQVPTPQMVVFRTIDASGNYNDCMVSAIVQDKIGPTITCPIDQTVNCDFPFNFNDLRTSFDWPTATDNCENLVINELPYVSTLDACRKGTIRRNFEVTDLGGRKASCSQLITFVAVSPFTIAGITWPADQPNLVGCADPTLPMFSTTILGRPTFADGACALVGADHVDQVFTFNNGNGPACFKILRYWTVIDWCQVVQLTGGGTGYATWKHTQTIIVSDNVAPVIGALDAEVSTCTFDAACASGNITLQASATDNCTNILAWRYQIDAFNNGGPLNGYDIVQSGNGNSANASGNYPVGTHRILWSFEDKCGNITSREQLFSIVNCKTPTPYCINGLSINLTPMDLDGDGTIDTGMADIWASDFDAGSNHPCSGYDVLLSLAPVTLDVNGNPVLTNGRQFDCSDRGNQPIQLYAAVVTPMGTVLQSFCSTFIIVQDNLGACTGNLVGNTVSGRIATENNDDVENVEVKLIGTELLSNTESNGKYIFGNILKGENYKVNPFKNDDIMNGVSTLDLVLIQRHILGIEALSSPYKLIAADVNKDGQLSTIDLIELRKVILGSQMEFTNNYSWRFVDNTYKFVNPANAQNENFTEIYQINNLSEDMIVDFTAVKVGDVNGNAKANINVSTESRNAQTIMLTAENQTFEAGERVEVKIVLSETTNLSGIQFTSKFNTEMLSILDVKNTLTSEENLGFANLSNGFITASWNSNQALELESKTEVMTITFIAKSAGNIESAFKIGSEITNAEAYNDANEVMNVRFEVKGSMSSEEFVLYQNTPNPFNDFTTISFDLPVTTQATLNIYDVTGKQIKVIKNTFEKGQHTIQINKNELGTSGLLYYNLQAGPYSATKKMVLID